MVKQPLTRREFIGTTAAAGAGLMLASGTRVFGQAKPAAHDKINIALVGFGAQGRVLLESLLKIDGVRLVAICDIWEYARTYGERYLKKMGVEVRAYENYEELLAGEKDLQAVVVACPDFWHAPITNACLKAGLDVYCEKMMSNTIEGARSMVQTMRETGRLLQIGHQRRSNPRYIFALNRLVHDAKILGRLTAANGQWNRAVTEDFGWPKKAAMSPEQLAKYVEDGVPAEPSQAHPSLARIEWEHITRVLKESNGNISETARKLGVRRQSLQKRLKKPVHH